HCFQLLLLLLINLWPLASLADKTNHEFLKCLSSPYYKGINLSEILYTPENSSYTSVLQSSIQNLRFAGLTSQQPSFIVTPFIYSQVQIVVLCAKNHKLEVRVRGGGHDFEGLSYVSDQPFVLIDLINLRNITVDVANGTAWVQSGANLGELNYRIAEKTSELAFPGGVWPTVGIGGFLSGGGYGSLTRKYGLGADSVIDYRFLNYQSNVFDRVSVIGSEDIFWAVRGGTASSFGIVLEWKIQLVPVPKTVTVFAVHRTLAQNATRIFHRWQYVAPNMHRDLYIKVKITSVKLTADGEEKTVQVSFESLFLGPIERLLTIMEKNFPELDLVEEDCTEMSWVKSTLWFANTGFPNGDSLELLLNRNAFPKLQFKGKSDLVQEPLSEEALNGIWKLFFELEAGEAQIEITPYGGKMDEFAESALPFPHRAGNFYMILEGVQWNEKTPLAEQIKLLKWLERLHTYLTPFVSKNPRRSYVNYNDLDLGVGCKTYDDASIWGEMYFKDNFKRLVQVKTEHDPNNFFRHDQSIPVFRGMSSLRIDDHISQLQLTHETNF
ncbi:tetrahydroberberine oxidase-like, partial [Apium graveolens]|uniref:tetrahydroberberine oxidase-like n=1 Tax=Apium graveolens TaxID=4045 RepID=UPI003D7AF2B3